jgi:hypothetical protein
MPTARSRALYGALVGLGIALLSGCSLPTSSTPKPTPKPSPTVIGTPALELLIVSMPPNGNFEYCTAGLWPNPIIVRNAGGETLHWFAVPPPYFHLGPDRDDLQPGQSVLVTISGGPYSSPNGTFDVQFPGYTHSYDVTLRIPCR